MDKSEQLIDEIIRTELKKYRFFYSDNEKLMIENSNYLDLVTEQQEKLKLYTWLVIILILIFSGTAIYLFISFGNNDTVFLLFLGLFFWIAVIASTYLFSKELVAKRQSMDMIIKLLNRS